MTHSSSYKEDLSGAGPEGVPEAADRLSPADLFPKFLAKVSQALGLSPESRKVPDSSVGGHLFSRLLSTSCRC